MYLTTDWIEKLNVEILQIDECPNSEETVFAGSPTIVVDGQDLFPSEGQTNDLACRIYFTPQGLAGLPTLAQLTEALARHNL